ncbi:MAG: hypothetical protein IKT27_00960 [Clostridia bacterium]|nr:hypothetical protein [Clostridia bacterium]
MTGGSNRPGGRRFPDNFVVAEPTLRPVGGVHPKNKSSRQEVGKRF